MNVRAFETQQFAFKYYNKILNAKRAIDNTSPYKPKIHYSSRNTTHMTRYQQQLKTKKLINKLLEIHNQNINIKDASTNKKANQKKTKSKRRLTRKNRKLSFSENKTFSVYNKSLINPFKAQEKSNLIHTQNCELIDKLTDVKSTYSKQLAKKRQKILNNYTKILKKSKQQEQIRDQYFEVFQHFRTTFRPASSKKESRKSRIMSATTRPQTARQN